jgi:hypothetical protein
MPNIIELVIYEKIINTMVENINMIHNINFIQHLLIFYDGMPSISKVIEQRRRRIKNHLESNQKKLLFKTYFDDLLPNNKRLFECLSKNWVNHDKCQDVNNIVNNDVLFDYFKWIQNRFSVDKSIGPSSIFIKNLELFKVHRLLYEIHYAEPLKSLHCLHKCDNPSCVNPLHLLAGTNLDNVRDKVNKGRCYTGYQKGESNGSSKLKDADVIVIRKLYKSKNYTTIKLGKMYKVHRSTISHIVNNKTYTHLLEN